MNPADMTAKVIANLPAKTGKTLDEWIAIYRADAPQAKKVEARRWFKTTHGIGGVTADIIMGRAEGRPSMLEDDTPDDALLESQYAGSRAPLRPIYDQLAELAASLGEDVRFVVGKTQVTIARTRQIAIIWPKPGRIELGLALPGVAAGGRLEPVKGANDRDRIRVFVRLESIEAIDAQVAQWLRQAYADDLKGLSATESAALTKSARKKQRAGPAS
ncbi:MAG: DUF5655 domain-containing protein [Acidobacteria bacterium]|nr:DUF5655 domain-containing protein [Acidobacteriota bacterium]